MAEIIDCADWLRDPEVECFDDTEDVVKIKADCWRCQIKSFDWAEATLGVRIQGVRQAEGEEDGVGPLDVEL